MTPLSSVHVSTSALRHNVGALRSLVPEGGKLVAVVKANAYGHGLREVVEATEDLVDAFQVDDIEELRALRLLTDKRALVLGCVGTDDFAEAICLDGELSLFDRSQLPALRSAANDVGKTVRVHLEVDALLGRLGVLPTEVAAIEAELLSEDVIEMAGIYAHFANIEDTTDLAHATNQIEAFEAAASGFQGIPRHISATSGLMTVEGKQTRNDLVRLGIGLYGLYPSAALERTHADLGLQPAMRWVSHLAQVKTLPARHPVSYGLTYITSRPTRVGVVPQGYSDGYDRHLSSSGEVLIRGRRCRVLGRVAMNMMVVELEDVPNANAGDEVVLLGGQGDDAITAEELALRVGTINYEVVARISPLLPRLASF